MGGLKVECGENVLLPVGLFLGQTPLIYGDPGNA